MSDLQEIAYEQANSTKGQSERCLLTAFAYLGIPATMVDIGCNGGHLVKLAARLGVQSTGIDSNLPEEYRVVRENCILLRMDLTLTTMDRFWEKCSWESLKSDLTLCWEVGEHLPPDFADRLCNILGTVTLKTLIFTAASKGQGGAGHLNEQPQEYWRGKLEAHGFIWEQEKSRILSVLWKVVSPDAWWYAQNCQVFSCEK